MSALLKQWREIYPGLRLALRHALWPKVLLATLLSFAPLAAVLTPGVLPIDMANGKPALDTWNALLGIMRFLAVGAALLGVVLLLLTVVLAVAWFRARRFNPFAAADPDAIAARMVEMIPPRDSPSPFTDVRPPR